MDLGRATAINRAEIASGLLSDTYTASVDGAAGLSSTTNSPRWQPIVAAMATVRRADGRLHRSLFPSTSPSPLGDSDSRPLCGQCLPGTEVAFPSSFECSWN